jgi:hypothetical protein
MLKHQSNVRRRFTTIKTFMKSTDIRITVAVSTDTDAFLTSMMNKKQWNKSQVANFLIEYAIRAMQAKKKQKHGITLQPAT